MDSDPQAGQPKAMIPGDLPTVCSGLGATALLALQKSAAVLAKNCQDYVPIIIEG